MIKRRWLLICLITGAQAACLLGGVLWFGHWLSGGLLRRLEASAIITNRLIAADVAGMIEQSQIDAIDPDCDGWSRLQSLLRQARLPHGGFVAILDADGGTWVCPPGAAPWNGPQSERPGQARLRLDDGGATVPLSAAASGSQVLTGRVELFDETHLAAVRDIRDARAKVLVCQSARRVAESAADFARPVMIVGLVAAIIIVLFNKLVTVAIMLRYEDRLAASNADLEVQLRRREDALTRTRDAIIFGLAKLAESRDDDTGEHLERISEYVQILARELQSGHPELNDEAIRRLAVTSSLHDIGKVGVPDAVLLKPGPLTRAERAIIERHTEIGGACLLALKARLGGDDEFLRTACEIALAHHEKWDGSGYPFGLKGSEIPLSARIVALADVYDALTSQRVYKRAMSHELARRVILEGRGKHFDPQVVEAFLARESEFYGISRSAQGKSPLGGRRERYESLAAAPVAVPEPVGAEN